MALVGDDVAMVLDDLAGLTLPEKRLHRCNVDPARELGLPGANWRYILHKYIHLESAVASKTAKLFVNGGSQAVRLPAEFRFDNSDEVFIRRDAVTGDVILSARRTSNAWRDFFALRDQAEVPADFMNDRPLNEPLKPREFFEDR